MTLFGQRAVRQEAARPVSPSGCDKKTENGANVTASIRLMRARATCAVAGLAALLCASAAGAEPAAVQDSSEEPTDFSPLLTTPLATARKAPAPEKFAPALPDGWDGKAGIDYRPPAVPEFLPGAPSDPSAGVGWATVTVPGFSPGIDKATVETRIDPVQEQGKVAAKLSGSLPGGVSVTLQNAYSVMQTLPGTVLALPPGAAKSIAPTPSQVRGVEQSARINIAPFDTTLSFGVSTTNVDEKWHRSLSAEQKLFGGPVSVTGTLSETDTGTFSKSLKAGVKTTW
jgi:hypothetical protein